MKRILLASVFSLFCIGASAEEPRKIDVNCDTVALDVAKTDGFEFYALVRWEEPAIFPDLPKKSTVGGRSGEKQVGFEFECPQLYAKYDGNKLTVRADTVENALDFLTSEYYKYFDLYTYGWYDYPSIRKGYNSISYSINLYDYSLEMGENKVDEGQVLKRVDFRGVNNDIVIGYKVDNGNLKPLLYNSTVERYTGDMVDADIIDIYHKHDDKKFQREEKLQRIHIDKSKGLVEFYKKHPFPSS